MDADRFGFDSKANNSDDPCLLMNFPDVNRVVSLSLSEKSKEMLILSLDSHGVKNY